MLRASSRLSSEIRRSFGSVAQHDEKLVHSSRMTAWVAVRWLHLLAMAFFVGGQLMLAAAVVPVERASPDRARLQAIARRFGYGTLIAIAALVGSGSAMATHYHQWGSGTLHAKLALLAVVVALVIWHMRRPTMHVLEAAIFLASLGIVWLGVSLAHG
jgi:uncharacterized membrane protein